MIELIQQNGHIASFQSFQSTTFDVNLNNSDY